MAETASADPSRPEFAVIDLSRPSFAVRRAVREWRRREGLSLECAGRLLGVAHTTVRDWEAGRTPRDLHRARLASVLGVTIIDSSLLRQLRTDRGMPLKQLAHRLAVAQNTLAAWERGSRRPDRLTLARICRVLDLDPVNAVDLTSFYSAPGGRRPACDRTGHTRPGPRGLARFRRDRGLTQDAAARLLGISASTLSRCERGHRPVSLELGRRVAALYEVEFSQVVRAANVALDPLFDRRSWPHATLPMVLVALRSGRGSSVAAVARQLSVMPKTWRRWEAGVSSPSAELVRRIELCFGLNAGELSAVSSG